MKHDTKRQTAGESESEDIQLTLASLPRGKPPTRCALRSPLLPERQRGAVESERDSRLRTDGRGAPRRSARLCS
ncbi:hypothetical protein NQZ68_016253 [Dissostichus eleginoides]|nr:hypothetical protein NQZ68_016253 [Dissostichus eleginoides]